MLIDMMTYLPLIFLIIAVLFDCEDAALWGSVGAFACVIIMLLFVHIDLPLIDITPSRTSGEQWLGYGMLNLLLTANLSWLRRVRNTHIAEFFSPS